MDWKSGVVFVGNLKTGPDRRRYHVDVEDVSNKSRVL